MEVKTRDHGLGIDEVLQKDEMKKKATQVVLVLRFSICSKFLATKFSLFCPDDPLGLSFVLPSVIFHRPSLDHDEGDLD